MPWPTLAALQGTYNATVHPLERRAVGIAFERAVRELGADKADVAARAEAEAELLAIIDADPVAVDLDELGKLL